MLKTAGLLGVLICSVLIGIIRCRRLDDRVTFWNEFLSFLRFAESSIRYSAAPLAQLLEQYRRENGRLRLVERCCRELRRGIPLPDAWKTASEEEKTGSSLTEQDLQLLLDFGGGFGVSDVEGQVAHCGLFAARAEEVRKSAGEDRRRKGKLSLLLGVLAGLWIDLLLW